MQCARTLIFLLGLLGPQFAAADDIELLGDRTPWTTSRIHGTPDPPPPYQLERAFANLTFDEPLSLVQAPGMQRMFVAERYGKVYSFRTVGDVEKATVCFDVDSTIYGLALHPDFSNNGYIYITYLHPRVPRDDPPPQEAIPDGTRVSRFTVTSFDPPKCDLTSEKVIIRWPAGGHNGGCLKFGPDGYLYIALGDGSEVADLNKSGQDLTDLPAAILRINVDRETEGQAYSIPPDNPFVNVAGARPEIWSYGVRQVWRMNFDRLSGELWAGDVGQDYLESVLLIRRGGNYGWSVTEGTRAFRPERQRGPSPILPPIHEYDHTEGRSITGGYVYRGSRLKELEGAYIFADYDAGRVWGLRYDGSDVVWHEKLCESRKRIVSFGEAEDGEIYLVDHIGGGLHRLVPTDQRANSHSFPRKLSDTGLFAAVEQHTPAPGVIPYTINAQAWADGVQKQWFLAIPAGQQIEFDGIQYPDRQVPAGWKYPDGTVMVETISLETERGNRASLRRLETRILHHVRMSGGESVGDQVWNGYTYLWNEEQTDALLLDNPEGLDGTFEIIDPDNLSPTNRLTKLKWHFPSRNECTVCHNMSARYILSGNTLQLNKDHDYGHGVVVNQIRALEHWGLFDEALPVPVEKMQQLVNHHDPSQELDDRARAYLHANCAFCHRTWGGGNAEFKLVYTLGLDDAQIVDAKPAHGTFGLPDARLVAPGDPFRSVLFYRLAKLGSGRMPRAGPQTIDAQGLRLVRDWIAGLPAPESPAQGVTDQSDSMRTARRVLDNPTATSASRLAAAQELLQSTRGALVLSQLLDKMPTRGEQRNELLSLGTSHPNPDVSDLFERFLPPEQRTQRLGEVIDVEKILAINGSAARGRELFLSDRVQCKGCHRIHGTEVVMGPNLNEIGKKYDAAALLETIVNPSKKIDAQFAAFLVTLNDGTSYTGLIQKRDEKEVVLRTADKKTANLPMENVEELLPQSKSFMPDQLLRDLTARDAADLLAYLSSLK